jgi:hypothetical protein
MLVEQLKIKEATIEEIENSIKTAKHQNYLDKVERARTRKFDPKYKSLFVKMLKNGYSPREIWWELFPSEDQAKVVGYMRRDEVLNKLILWRNAELNRQTYLPIEQKRLMAGYCGIQDTKQPQNQQSVEHCWNAPQKRVLPTIIVNR